MRVAKFGTTATSVNYEWRHTALEDKKRGKVRIK